MGLLAEVKFPEPSENLGTVNLLVVKVEHGKMVSLSKIDFTISLLLVLGMRPLEDATEPAGASELVISRVKNDRGLIFLD
jgi:hypothetical protein